MSAWDEPTVKIGKNVGGGGGPREVTVRSRSAQNNAARAGNLTSSKKAYGTANGSATSVMNGQRAAAVDRLDAPLATKKKPKQLQMEENLTTLVTALGLNRATVSKGASSVPQKIWTARATDTVDYVAIGRIESKYQWKVNGTWGAIRQPKPDQTQLIEWHEKLHKAKPRQIQAPPAAKK